MQCIRAINKYRQFAPAGPDVKTVARFRRRCGKRYVPMTRLLLVLIVSLSQTAVSKECFEPDDKPGSTITFSALSSEGLAKEILLMYDPDCSENIEHRSSWCSSIGEAMEKKSALILQDYEKGDLVWWVETSAKDFMMTEVWITRRCNVVQKQLISIT